MASQQPAESGAVKYAEPERTPFNHLGKKEEYFLVVKNDNKVQNSLAVFFPWENIMREVP